MVTDKLTVLRALVSLSLIKSSKETKQDMLRAMDNDFRKTIEREYGMKVALVQEAEAFSEDDGGSDCRSYLEFTSDGMSVIVALEGYWSSYDGYVYNQWYFCKPQPLTKVEYVKE